MPKSDLAGTNLAVTPALGFAHQSIPGSNKAADPVQSVLTELEFGDAFPIGLDELLLDERVQRLFGNVPDLISGSETT